MSIEYPRSSHPWDSLLHHVISSWKTHHASRAQPSNENHFRNWICIGMFDNNNNKRQTLNTQQKIQSFKLMSFFCRSSIQWKRITHNIPNQVRQDPFTHLCETCQSQTLYLIKKSKKKIVSICPPGSVDLVTYNLIHPLPKTFLSSSKTN